MSTKHWSAWTDSTRSGFYRGLILQAATSIFRWNICDFRLDPVRPPCRVAQPSSGLDPIGRTVRLRGFPYRVIGVLEERGSLFGQSLDNFAIAPARSPIQAVTNPRGVVDEVIIQTLDPDRLREAQAEAEGIMRTRRRLRPADLNNFTLETAEDAISFWDNISRVLFTALPGLVAISLGEAPSLTSIT